MRHNGLYLHEEILLLALRDEEGTIAMGTQYSLALGGALLAELLLQERIKVEESKRKKLVVLPPRAKPVGEPLLDECFEKIKTAKRRASLQTWVGRLARVKQLRHRVALGLCERRILKADEDKVLLIFKRKIYPEIDPTPERELIARLRRAIFTYTRELDPRTIVLVALAHSSGILKVVFDKKKLKGRKKRLDQITKGDLVGTATREAIEAVQAAMIIAATVPVMAATTAAH
jgi:hypothetical protein